MMGQTEQIGEELRSLLSAAIAAAEPMLAQLTAADGAAGSCTWCPVCALVALSRGRQHPLLTPISVHGASILTILRDAIESTADNHGGQTDSAADSQATAQDHEQPEPAQRRTPAFERISVILREGVLGGTGG